MSFRFSLESVLDFRKSVEQSEETELLRIVQNINTVRGELQQLDASKQTVREYRNSELAARLPAAHLRAWDEHEKHLISVSSALSLRLQSLEIRRQKQLLILRDARRNRELLSKVREQRLKAYQREESRREQNAIDDLFLLQLMFSRK